MQRQPVISGKKLLPLLKKKGFVSVRQKGSHVFVRNNKNKGTVVPVHGNEDLGKGLLKSILDDLDLNIEDLLTRDN